MRDALAWPANRKLGVERRLLRGASAPGKFAAQRKPLPIASGRDLERATRTAQPVLPARRYESELDLLSCPWLWVLPIALS